MNSESERSTNQSVGVSSEADEARRAFEEERKILLNGCVLVAWPGLQMIDGNWLFVSLT